MKIADTDLSDQILKSSKKKLGDIFFFPHYAVIEINEGIHLDIHNASEIFEELLAYFGSTNYFGVIANRVNSYSVNLLDGARFKKKLKNLCAYAAIGYSAASQMNAEIENTLCLSEKIVYYTIYEAIESVCKKVKDSNPLFSN